METKKAIALPIFIVLGLALIAMPAVSAGEHSTVYINGYILFKNGTRCSAYLTLFQEAPEGHTGFIHGWISCCYGAFYFCSDSYAQYNNFLMINAQGSPHNDFGGSGTPLKILIYHKSPFLFLAYSPDFVFVGKGYSLPV